MEPQEVRDHIITLEGLARKLEEWGKSDEMRLVGNSHCANRVGVARQSALNASGELRAVLKDMLIEEFLSDGRG